MTELSNIQKQLAFIVELDKLKSVLRMSSPIGMGRRENSAEHSWQVVLCSIIFQEHANEPVDILKVIKMLAIHDVVEIDVGDVFHYSKDAQEDLFDKEYAAAKRMFGLLNEELGSELLSLWLEFEKKESPEARYARAIDRTIAFVMNANNEGGTWKKHGIKVEQVFSKNAHAALGSKALWKMAQDLVNDSFNKGYIKKVETCEA